MAVKSVTGSRMRFEQIFLVDTNKLYPWLQINTLYQYLLHTSNRSSLFNPRHVGLIIMLAPDECCMAFNEISLTSSTYMQYICKQKNAKVRCSKRRPNCCQIQVLLGCSRPWPWPSSWVNHLGRPSVRLEQQSSEQQKDWRHTPWSPTAESSASRCTPAFLVLRKGFN